MNYELALKLKNAGFPQNQSGEYITDQGNRYTGAIGCKMCEGVYFPTLSELIGAFQGRYKYIEGLINDAQFVLTKTVGNDGHKYIAALDGDWESYELKDKYRFISESPEEAVANLYLAVHQ